MTIEYIIRIVAGSLILVSLALGAPGCPIYIGSNFLWVTVFVGANLFQSGFTGFCPLEIFLKKLLG
ncbi:MAG: DUF2892 domain-containing protein [Legionellaceae bacterium]|nr:DUF2892 domain-containing protein [Legionellaceae bacterium]MBP9775265.1 DUF2892 domain-containing protein [Legionellaceae bacterium]